MTVTEFLPHYSVEICGPKHGSGYRIGGRLVLTAAHLFTELGTCQVRSKGIGDSKRGAFKEVEAIVVWIASGVDIALVELPVEVEDCDPVQFGLLPEDQNGNSVGFDFYGYPRWGSTSVAPNSRGSGGRHVKGEIRLSDTSFEWLVVLRSENASDNTSDGSSPWVGASGSAIVCHGLVVAVQSQHQNPKMFTALEAAPLSKVYQCSEWCDFLEKHGISSKSEQIQLPRAKRSSKKQTSSLKSAGRSSKNNVVDLFWELDYKRQERDFIDRLDTLESCAAFSVVAPCEMTQRWLLNRLKKKIPNQQNAVVIPPMNLRQHPMQGNFKEFWIDLAQQVGTQPSKDEILRSLCHSQVERPIILTIYGFRDFGPTQRKIIREFWEPLTGMMNQGSKRSGRSRVVLFLVDQCRPNYDSKSIVPLDPFDELLQKDVERWFESDAVVEWCRKKKFGDRWGETWLEREVPQDEWENPSLIFDRLCTKFQLGNGDMDIQDVWKWAS